MVDDSKPQGTETDSVPRVSARDLFMVLQIFDRRPETTLEEVRLRICVDREKQRRGTALWSSARDTAGELVKLGLIEGTTYSRTSRLYEAMKSNKLTLTNDGKQMIGLLKVDKKKAYDELFQQLVARHAYVRDFIRTLKRTEFIAPVISSMKDHVAPRYSTNSYLTADLAAGKFETKIFLARLAERLRRELRPAEETEIVEKLREMVGESKRSAVLDDGIKVAKLVLNRLNDIIIPAVFRSDALGFDARSHRALWSMGEDFRTWATLRSHPEYDAWLIYGTATIELSTDGTQLAGLEFDHGLRQTGENFLAKLYAAYQRLQALRGNTFVPAWELRAIFCFDNRCQPSVFNNLFDQDFSQSQDFKLHLEIQRQKLQHESPVRAGNRNIGTVRVVKR
jgi:hypothetical protein